MSSKQKKRSECCSPYSYPFCFVLSSSYPYLKHTLVTGKKNTESKMDMNCILNLSTLWERVQTDPKVFNGANVKMAKNIVRCQGFCELDKMQKILTAMTQ
jgi:hypothetical protein